MVFLYVNAQARRQAAVQDFVQHFIGNSQRLALQTGYLPMPAGEEARALPSPPPAALTGALSVAPEVIQQGQTARLSWSTENATSAEIDNGVGAVAARGGSHAIEPQATTTYTLTISGAGGQSLRRQVVVRVEPALALRGSLAASRQRIEPGERVKLSWSASNAASASIDRGIGAVSLPRGSREVAPDATTTYTLTLTGPDGRTFKNQVTVLVGGASQTPGLPPSPPQGTLRIEPAVVAAGDETRLIWAIANAAQAEIDNGVGAVAPRAGSVRLRPRTTTTYTLTVVGVDGSRIVHAQASVQVRPRPPVGVWPFAIAGLAAALLMVSLVYWRSKNTASVSAPAREAPWRASRRVPFRNQMRPRVEPEPAPPPPPPAPLVQTSAKVVGDCSPRIFVEEGPGRGLEIVYAVTGEPASISIETERQDGSGPP
jgi:hypothetical protein